MFPFSVRQQGPAVDTLRNMRHSKTFRHAKVYTRGKGKHLTQLIIGIGQMHPVLKGRFSYLQARKIGKIQSWIYHFCYFFVTEYQVSTFGQEGFSLKKAEVGYARTGETTLKEARKGLDNPDLFFTRIAQKWRRAVKKGGGRKEANLLNGLTLLQAANPEVTIFPIEQRAVHGAIGNNIDELRSALHEIEQSSAYKQAIKKKGKELTEEEYTAVVEKSELVKQFNAMLNHKQRDRAILQEVVRHAEQMNITVFVLGQAHRKALLKLAKRHLPEDTLFVWVTPPQLWWWHTWIYRLFWIGVFIVVLAVILVLQQ